MSWQELAKEAARFYNLDERIMLATVEAETGGRNVLGDDGNALGYGQVWAQQWHYPKLQEVAGVFGLTPPPQNDLVGLQNFVLGNDRVSMYLAAKAVKGFWDSAGGDWDTFTRGYVGPGIPSSDMERRRVIWNRYGGENVPAGAVVASGGPQELLKVVGGSGQALIVTGALAGLILALVSGNGKEG